MNELNRKLYRLFAASAVVLLLLAGIGWAQDQAQTKNESEIEKRIHASANVLDEIMSTPDKAVPDKVMSEAKCIAVVPSMVRIAIGFGGSHGKGVATCRTATGWSAPSPITITGGSWGLQLGGEAVDLVLVVMNEKGMDDLLSDKFKVGASASAAAGPVGRTAGADTDWKLKAEMLTYSRSRGVFAGIDLNGSAITQDKDETRLLYGHMVPFTDILHGKVEPPHGSHAFLATVEKYSRQAKGETPASGN